MQKTLTFSLNLEQTEEVFLYLKSVGGLVPNSNQYVKWSLKGPKWTALLYTSGKFVLQTSENIVASKIEKMLTNDKNFKTHIGSDEVGKGDYFGPLIICCCYLNKEVFEKIKKYRIMDSKKISDEKIWELGEILIKFLNYEIRIISPVEYAKLNRKYKNVGIILAKAHVEVIEKLYSRVKENVEYVVVDQFSKDKKRLENEFKLSLPLKQYHHAESDIAVAIASIIARYSFLLEMDKMNRKYGVRFPLGATHVVKFGKSFVKKYGSEELVNVAKVSFRTTKQIIN